MAGACQPLDHPDAACADDDSYTVLPATSASYGQDADAPVDHFACTDLAKTPD
jgi:hypothetical protein